MRTFCPCWLACAAWLSTSAVGQETFFRFFFDFRGADEEEARSAGSLAFTNPTIHGAGRLYLYAEFGAADQEWTQFNLRVDVLGPGVITGAVVYDHDIPTLDGSATDRWETIPSGSLSPTTWITGRVENDDTGGYGYKNQDTTGQGAPSLVDSHFSGFVGGDGSPFGTTLLARIDLEHAGGTQPAELYLQNGSSGSGSVFCFSPVLPGCEPDFIYFGFGDPAVPNRKGGASGGPGGPTSVAEAFIAPPCEPCDVNCDNSINGFDIGPFVAALSSEPPDGCSPCAADANGDSSLNQFDIQPFMECLARP